MNFYEGRLWCEKKLKRTDAERYYGVGRTKKSLSTPDLPPQGKQGNKQPTFPDLLPVIFLVVMFITILICHKFFFWLHGTSIPSASKSLFILTSLTRAHKGRVHTMPCLLTSGKAGVAQVCDFPAFLPFCHWLSSHLQLCAGMAVLPGPFRTQNAG